MASYSEATRRAPPDLFPDINIPPDQHDNLGLEFQISDLNQRVDMDTLIPEMHTKLTQILPEDDVLGIEFKPSKRFAQKCIIVFANEAAKDKVRVRGLSIFGKNVDLSAPGQGVVKVEITNVSLLLPNDVLKNWLADQVGGQGNIVQFRHDHYFIRGQKRKWVSGTRFAWVKNLTVPLPPVAKIRYSNRDVSVNVWHYGQTHMKCRFCYQVVPKGHDCPRKQQKQGCHRCGSLGHLIKSCPETNLPKCLRCKSTEHTTSKCTIEVKKGGMGGRKHSVNGKFSGPASPSQKNNAFIIPHLIDIAEKKREEEKLRRSRQNQEALDERERQQKQAMEENQKFREAESAEEERKKRATAAENRRSPSPESSPPNDVDASIDHTDQMEVDVPASEEDEGDEDNSDEENDDDEQADGKNKEDVAGEGDTVSLGSEEDTSQNSEEEANEAGDDVVKSDRSEDEDEHDRTKFFEAFEEGDSVNHQSANLALVGGSNAPKLQLVSDDQLKVSTVTLWEGGANIIQGANKVKELNPDVRESIEMVILHLGTCDFPCQGTSTVVSHYMDYRDVTTKVSALCPNAHIIMSGLLPQAGNNRELANEQIRCFNDALQSVGEDETEPNLHFCDNWPHFVSDGNVRNELYSDPHTLGVHVNDPGSDLLSCSIMQCVKKVFYWERLGISLDVQS